MPGRPPTWTRDELILALDLYLSCGRKVLETTSPETIKLVVVINRLRFDDQPASVQPRRTPGSVKAKLANLRALDPSTESTGWGNGSRLDLEVWNQFADRPDALAHAASVIRARSNDP